MIDHRSTDAGMDLDETFRRERLALLRLALRLTGSREQAEDVVQTAFFRARDRWSTIERPAAYLRQVVVNQVKDASGCSDRQLRHPIDGDGRVVVSSR